MHPADTPQPALTVSELTQAIRQNLEPAFRFVHLQGEISNFKPHSSGHLYFSLKDAGAQIAAVMYRADAQTLSQFPKDGDQVTVKGSLNVYPPSGRYQVTVKELSLMGLGELLLKLERLKIKLHQKGWFRPERKKPLPKFPKTIGVVTSPTGAAIQDILNILTRRFSGFHLILNPVKVQGEGAAQEIAQAIEQFNRYRLADVLIVGRGGGSIEDLWAFNEEVVAEAIFNSAIPIISAVGHETDHCIADYVADVRAPTPSAAAEIVCAEKAAQLTHLNHIERRLQQGIGHLLKQSRQRLSAILRHPVISNPYGLLGPWMQRVDDIRSQADRFALQFLQQRRLRLEACRRHAEALKPTVQIAHHRQKLAHYGQSIQRLMDNTLRLKKMRLEKLQDTLKALDPRNVLAKGYSILFSEKDGSVINSVRTMRKEDSVKVLMWDGTAIAIIKDTIPK
jgi:exodeoxyribonuclease VII large subunit